MKFFSVFSGVGGFELGVKQAIPDAECVGQSEIDKFASAVLNYHYPDNNYGDITEIEWDRVPDFDLLVGGSPCQDMSVAGKGAGLAGSRSGLFSEYIRALQEKKPQYFIWENVKGSLSSNKGRDFESILNQMAEAGYSLWWQVLNAKDFGVPQNRERVFVVGSRTRPAREVFFERNSDAKNLGKNVANTIDANYFKGIDDHGSRTAIVYHRAPLRYLNRNQKNIEGDYAFTVDASQTAGVTDGMRVRRLTPLEAERLMSWPDDWTKYGCFEKDSWNATLISDSQRYKMCGNGVVSKVVEEVVKAHLL